SWWRRWPPATPAPCRPPWRTGCTSLTGRLWCRDSRRSFRPRGTLAAWAPCWAARVQRCSPWPPKAVPWRPSGTQWQRRFRPLGCPPAGWHWTWMMEEPRSKHPTALEQWGEVAAYEDRRAEIRRVVGGHAGTHQGRRPQGRRNAARGQRGRRRRVGHGRHHGPADCPRPADQRLAAEAGDGYAARDRRAGLHRAL